MPVTSKRIVADIVTAASPAFSWPVKIPSSLSPGNYVLRHEIIALHAAGSSNGAQNYPQVSDLIRLQRDVQTNTGQCINLLVSGSGSTSPTGVPATSFYKATDPGILIDIYSKISSYTIPGPALSGLKRRAAHARDWLLSA